MCCPRGRLAQRDKEMLENDETKIAVTHFRTANPRASELTSKRENWKLFLKKANHV